MEFAARPAKIYSVVERIKIKMAENKQLGQVPLKTLIALCYCRYFKKHVGFD